VREETKLAVQALALGLFVGALRVGWAFGGEAVTLLLGCVFSTAVLWAMVALRALANDKPPGPELDDGLTCSASTAWLIAAVPFRASTFLPDGATDDFAYVYLPVSLAMVFAMLAVRARWPQREVWRVPQRGLATSGVGLLLLAVLGRFVAGGPGAERLALAGLVGGGFAGVAAATLEWLHRSR
jgi:hypothetical protein